MFNKEEVRQQVIQYFKCVGSGENIVQAIKQALFLNQNFSPLLIFEMLSQGRQKIVRSDWKRYLVSRNISHSEKELRYFFRHNHFRQEITLNQFLQAMIPYNADVIRQFRAKYLQSLEIDDLDPEIQFIFAELMSNWIGLIRNLIKIRSQISQSATRRQIQNLIKEDLVLRSKPRQARKFHEMFQQSTFSLSFHELRKFLQLWLNSKQIVHEFYLLNVKRHIKCENPFEKIVNNSRKGKRAKSRSYSANKSRYSRSRSRSLSGSSVSRSLSKVNQQGKKRTIQVDKFKQNNKKQKNTISQNDQQQSYLKQISNKKPKNKYQKYDEFKRQLKQSFLNEGGGHGNTVRGINDTNRRQMKFDEQDDLSKKGAQKKFNNQVLQKNIKKEEKQIPGKMKNKPQNNSEISLVVKIFQQIVVKQNRLQKLRKQLAKQNDFNIINLFKVIDNSNKGYITPRSLQEFTEELNPNYIDFVNFYARQRDKLRFQEFNGIFRPLSKQLNEALDKRPQHRVPNPFKKQTKRLILQIIKVQTQLQGNLSKLRNQIRQYGASYKNIFEEIDVDKKGFIVSDDIKQLLAENNIYCEAKDMKCLMKLLNKKVNQRISAKQFTIFMDF